jgi:hypothetical protein
MHDDIQPPISKQFSVGNGRDRSGSVTTDPYQSHPLNS